MDNLWFSSFAAFDPFVSSECNTIIYAWRIIRFRHALEHLERAPQKEPRRKSPSERAPQKELFRKSSSERALQKEPRRKNPAERALQKEPFR